jgi:hypothetical protein
MKARPGIIDRYRLMDTIRTRWRGSKLKDKILLRTKFVVIIPVLYGGLNNIRNLKEDDFE